MSDGTLKFDTRIDMSGFESGLNEVESRTTRVGDIIKGTLGAGALKAAAGRVIDFGKKAISLASDLDEVQNVVDVTFGEAEHKIEAFAETASQQFGLTEIQVKQFSGTFGAMVKSMGLSESAAADLALDMTALTADMASFYNLDHETAFEKLRAGLSGETEPLKALGINMSVANLEAFALAEGIETAYDEMTEAEKVQLRYNYIMDATSDSQGDFARTSDGFANQLRLLSNNIDSLAANIGAALLPAATAGLQAINSLFDGGGSNQTLEEIRSIADAITGENGLTAQIDDIRQNYAETSINLRVNYGKANTLLDEYDELLQKYMAGGEYTGANLKIGMDSAEIEKLQSDLRALNYEISDESGVFGESTLAAVRAFQEASNLSVDGIAGVQTQAALIAQTTEDLQDMAAQLVALYPELEQYVGENGLFTQEIEQVQALIDKYDELARAKAYQTMITDSQNAYYGAEANYEQLITRRDTAADELAKAQERAINAEAVAEAAKALDFGAGIRAMTDPGGLFKSPTYENIDNAAIETRLRLLQQIYELDPARMTEIMQSVSTEFDWSFLSDTNLLEDYIAQMYSDGGLSEKAAQTISSLMSTLVPSTALLASDSTGTLYEDSVFAIAGQAAFDVNQYVEAITAADTGLEAAAETLNTTRDDLITSIETYNRVYGDTLGKLPANVGEVITYNAAEAQSAVDTVLAGFESDVTARVNSILASIRRLGNANVAGTPAVYGSSHATGLDYVPYDGYRATLHVGERVMTAAENRAYTQQSGLDAGALIDALSSLTADRRDIVITLDGRELARYMADANREALADRANRLARGRGL